MVMKIISLCLLVFLILSRFHSVSPSKTFSGFLCHRLSLSLSLHLSLPSFSICFSLSLYLFLFLSLFLCLIFLCLGPSLASILTPSPSLCYFLRLTPSHFLISNFPAYFLYFTGRVNFSNSASQAAPFLPTHFYLFPRLFYKLIRFPVTASLSLFFCSPLPVCLCSSQALSGNDRPGLHFLPVHTLGRDVE